MAIAPELISQPLPVETRKRSDSFAARLSRHRLAQVGGALILVFIFIAAFAQWISPIDPSLTLPHGLGTMGEAHAPGNGFLLGADTLGRDVWTRTLYGSRISLLVGVFAMTTAVVIGTTAGLLSGYFGGWVDACIMRVVEVVQSLPTILLAIALVAVLPDEPIHIHGLTIDRRLFNLLLAIGLVTWTGIARAVRGQTLSLREQEFVEAARAVGCGHGTIIWRHLLPNVMPTVIVLATLATANNILLQAGLSYLGLGVDPSIPSWGGMISEGQPYILSAPWIILAPGCAVALAVVSFNLMGTALQETLDPRR